MGGKERPQFNEGAGEPQEQQPFGGGVNKPELHPPRPFSELPSNSPETDQLHPSEEERDAHLCSMDFFLRYVPLAESEVSPKVIPSDKEVRNDPNLIARLQLGLELMYRRCSPVLRARDGERISFSVFLGSMAQIAIDRDDPLSDEFSRIRDQYLVTSPLTSPHRFYPDPDLN